MIPTLPLRGASLRTTTFGSITRMRSPCAAVIPARASSTTRSGLLMSFFIRSSLSILTAARRSAADDLQGIVREKGLVCETAQRAADEWANDRDPAVGPVRITLAGDWEERMGDARPKVTRRVDRISGGSAKRQADAKDEKANQQRCQCTNLVRTGGDAEYAEHQDEGPDDLADEVGDRVADCRAGAEHGQLEAGILRGLPVRQKVQVNHNRSDEGTDE